MKALIGRVGLIVLAAVVVVAAAGGAAYIAVRTAMGKPAEPPAQVDKKSLKPVDIGEFLTNLADPGGRRVIHLKIEIRVDDDKVAAQLKEEESAIRDQVLRVLRGKTVADLAGEDGMDQLADEIMNRLNVTVADGRIRELFFTDIAIQ